MEDAVSFPCKAVVGYVLTANAHCALYEQQVLLKPLIVALNYPKRSNIVLSLLPISLCVPDIIETVAKMSSSVNIKDAQSKNIVAALVPDASRARVEIEEFLGDNDTTNLYLLALEAMMKEDPTKSTAKRNEDWWTFYSLAGE